MSDSKTPSYNLGEPIVGKPIEVTVGEKGVERAIKTLKRKMASEGVLRELKKRRHHMKPSIKRRKKESEAARRKKKRDKVVVTAKPGTAEATTQEKTSR